MTPAQHKPHAGTAPADDRSGDAPGDWAQGEPTQATGAEPSESSDSTRAAGEREAQGRHVTAIEVLTRAIEPVVEDMGFELLLLEWLGSGKRRVMRLFLDHPDGVSVADCSKMSRIVGNALDASEAATGTDPALLALLGRAYTLEVSSPGVDRPLTKRRHFADHVGGRVKLELWSPLTPEEGGLDSGPIGERNFHGRIAGVEVDPDAPDDPRRGVVVVHDGERQRTLRFSLPRIRRANLVWEFTRPIGA